jgi:hypothetical protein
MATKKNKITKENIVSMYMNYILENGENQNQYISLQN